MSHIVDDVGGENVKMSYCHKLAFSSLYGLSGVVNLCSPESARSVDLFSRDMKHEIPNAQEVQESCVDAGT